MQQIRKVREKLLHRGEQDLLVLLGDARRAVGVFENRLSLGHEGEVRAVPVQERGNVRDADIRLRSGFDRDLARIAVDRDNIELLRDGADERDAQQIRCRCRNVAEPVLQLVLAVTAVIERGNFRDLLVNIEFLRLVDDVGFRHVGVDAKPNFAGLLLCDRLSLRFRDSRIQHLAVKIIADLGHVAVLGLSEDASGAADLKVAHGDAVAAAEVREFPDGRKAFLRLFSQHPVALVHQECIGCPG